MTAYEVIMVTKIFVLNIEIAQQSELFTASNDTKMTSN